MKQHTLKRSYSFEGKGLHSGLFSRMTLHPADEGEGIVFVRTDLPGLPEIPALAQYVSSTERSTAISRGEATAMTVEHILSALTGLGVDNARVELSGPEVPILDGSAKPYIDAIVPDGTAEQNAERKYIEIEKDIEIRDEKSGSFIRISPAPSPGYTLTADFNSKVLGVQTVNWDETVDYKSEIGICRTFVFFHEIEFLFKNNLIKGGDVDNAIVIAEHPVSEEQVQSLASLLGKEKLSVTESGYLDNLELRFSDECGRHKLLDLIGDLRLAGGFLKARVEAYKPGHTINTTAAKAILDERGNKSAQI